MALPGTFRCSRVPGTISGLRAGPYGPVGLRNAPAGAVRASSPTEVCYNVGMSFPGWPRRFPLAVGADSISARGRLRRRGVRRDEGIPPYGRPGGYGRPGWPVVCHGL